MSPQENVFRQYAASMVRVRFALLQNEPHVIGLLHWPCTDGEWFEPLERIWDTDHADVALERVMFAMSDLAQIVREEGEIRRTPGVDWRWPLS